MNEDEEDDLRKRIFHAMFFLETHQIRGICYLMERLIENKQLKSHDKSDENIIPLDPANFIFPKQNVGGGVSKCA